MAGIHILQPPAAATIVIVARNASGTIGRAIRSALRQGAHPIVLVDDRSDDETGTLAAAIAGDRLQVIRLSDRRPLGFSRQQAVEAVTTRYAVWLDADDELLDGRVARLVRTLDETGADIVADAAEILYEGRGAAPQRLPIPGFLGRDPWLTLQFERNYLPAPGAIAFRTDRLRELGYDPAFHGAEDMDLLLRASAAEYRFALVAQPGYRIHARPRSLSRQIENQRTMYRRALSKHSYRGVERQFTRAGYDAHVTHWALMSMATYRGEYERALSYVERIPEPDAPAPTNIEAALWHWRLAFSKGTLLLLEGKITEGRTWLQRANSLRSTPEGANNLGVASLVSGDLEGADRLFTAALEACPGYRDAIGNLTRASGSPYITTHPLRTEVNRSDYEGPAGRAA